MENKSYSIREILQIAENKLENQGISSAKLNAELLLCEICNFSRLDLKIHSNQILSNSQLKKYTFYIEKRANFEPLQYIIGYVDFHKIRLKINKSALIPRPETEQLVEIISQTYCNSKNFNKKNKINNLQNILDICTGSGCISLSLAKLFSQKSMNFQIDAIDISSEAINLAKENQKNLKIEKVNFINIDFYEFINSNSQKYDLIVCNPPYVSIQQYNLLEKELFFEPKIALTDDFDGLSFYKLIKNNVEKLLAENGKLFFECGINQAEKICEMFEKIEYKVTVLKDFDKIDRFLLIER